MVLRATSSFLNQNVVFYSKPISNLPAHATIKVHIYFCQNGIKQHFKAFGNWSSNLDVSFISLFHFIIMVLVMRRPPHKDRVCPIKTQVFLMKRYHFLYRLLWGSETSKETESRLMEFQTTQILKNTNKNHFNRNKIRKYIWLNDQYNINQKYKGMITYWLNCCLLARSRPMLPHLKMALRFWTPKPSHDWVITSPEEQLCQKASTTVNGSTYVSIWCNYWNKLYAMYKK